MCYFSYFLTAISCSLETVSLRSYLYDLRTEFLNSCSEVCMFVYTCISVSIMPLFSVMQSSGGSKGRRWCCSPVARLCLLGSRWAAGPVSVWCCGTHRRLVDA